MIFLSRIKHLVDRFETRGPRIAVFGDSHSVAVAARPAIFEADA